jgi:hypothetical protein
MRTVPVKYSGGPLLEGCEPFFLMSILNSFVFVIPAEAGIHPGILSVRRVVVINCYDETIAVAGARD